MVLITKNEEAYKVNEKTRFKIERFQKAFASFHQKEIKTTVDCTLYVEDFEDFGEYIALKEFKTYDLAIECFIQIKAAYERGDRVFILD